MTRNHKRKLCRLRASSRWHGWFCHLCGIKIDQTAATLDHIIPRSLGGKTIITNLRLACQICNKNRQNEPLLWFKMRTLIQNKFPMLEMQRYTVRHHRYVARDILLGRGRKLESSI